MCVCVFIYYQCFNGYKVCFYAVRVEHKFWENNLYKMDDERVRSLNCANDIFFITVLG